MLRDEWEAAKARGCGPDIALVVPEDARPARIDVAAGRPADWPKLEQLVERLPDADTQRACSRYMSAGPPRRACAVVNFAAGTCRIVLADSSTRGNYDHERMHCMGYDHAGETTVRDAWSTYKEERARRSTP